MTQQTGVYPEISELVVLLHNEAIAPAQLERLNTILTDNPDGQKYYLECISVQMGLHTFVSSHYQVSRASQEKAPFEEVVKLDMQDSAIRDMITENEATKRALEEELLRQHRETQANIPTRSCSPLWVRVLKVAALVMVALGIIWLDRVLHQMVNRQPAIVGTLTDTYQARWDVSPLEAESGNFLRAKPMRLLEGLAEITLESGSQILVQAPCEFRLMDSNRLFLETGSISATVPQQANGFTIVTYGGEVIDYGTEFAVRSDFDGEITTSVFKGRIAVTSDADRENPQYLQAGQSARRYRSGEIKRIAYQQSFVRAIPQKQTFGLPGKRIDLADIVAGGHGYGTGNHELSLHPLTGRFSLEKDWNFFYGAGDYVLVPDSEVIDGIFIPNGAYGSVQTDSAGHRITNLPVTENRCYGTIVTQGPIPVTDESDSQGRRMVMQGVVCGGSENPAIFFHSNLGVTFDLQAIRDSLPPYVQITRFTSQYGFSEESPRPPRHMPGNADFWVIVDGQIKWSKTGFMYNHKPDSVTVELDPNSRFLTLMTTDNNGKNHNDYCMFAQPSLVLATINFTSLAEGQETKKP